MANFGLTVKESNLHLCGLYPLFFWGYFFGFILGQKLGNFWEFFSFLVELWLILLNVLQSIWYQKIGKLRKNAGCTMLRIKIIIIDICNFCDTCTVTKWRRLTLLNKCEKGSSKREKERPARLSLPRRHTEAPGGPNKAKTWQQKN